MKHKGKTMRVILFALSVFIMILSVFYFSWLDSPRLGLTGMLPSWLIVWADAAENENLRTGVPFVFLGISLGIHFIRKSARLKKWFLCWVLLTTLALIAELGQLFLPLRSFDVKDIGWGALGAAAGLITTYGLSFILLRIHTFSNS